MDQNVLITISYIIKFCGGHSKRCFVEGEKVHMAKNVIKCGIQEISGGNFKIISVCLQSTNPKKQPWEIIMFIPVANKQIVNNATCTCPAGQGGKCKHIVATLFYINQTSTLRILTSTEVKQNWGKVAKKAADQMYAPRILSENNCCRKTSYKSFTVPSHSSVDKENFAMFVNGCPWSSVAQHTFGRSSNVFPPLQVVSTAQSLDPEMLRNLLINNVFLSNLNLNKFSLEPELAKFFKAHVELSLSKSIEIIQSSLSQSGHIWLYERSKRITGTSCYGLFTYSKNKSPDWNRKLGMHVTSKTDNKNFKYGRDTEKLAFKNYSNHSTETVINLGFVVNPNAAWLGCSPDGYIPSQNKLLEIKCPTKGETLSLLELIPSVSYIIDDNNNFQLKQNHPYFGQLQLNMFILGCASADFVIYSKKSDEILTINVPINQQFVLEMVMALKQVYFEKMLPFFCHNNIFNIQSMTT